MAVGSFRFRERLPTMYEGIKQNIRDLRTVSVERAPEPLLPGTE